MNEREIENFAIKGKKIFNLDVGMDLECILHI
jgi:hypothetical protein